MTVVLPQHSTFDSSQCRPEKNGLCRTCISRTWNRREQKQARLSGVHPSQFKVNRNPAGRYRQFANVGEGTSSRVKRLWGKRLLLSAHQFPIYPFGTFNNRRWCYLWIASFLIRMFGGDLDVPSPRQRVMSGAVSLPKIPGQVPENAETRRGLLALPPRILALSLSVSEMLDRASTTS